MRDIKLIILFNSSVFLFSVFPTFHLVSPVHVGRSVAGSLAFVRGAVSCGKFYQHIPSFVNMFFKYQFLLLDVR